MDCRPFVDIDARHVIDDDRHVERTDERRKFDDVLPGNVNGQMPAERPDARGDRPDRIQIRAAAEMREEVEARTAHAARVVPLEHLVQIARPHERDALVAPASVAQCIEQRPVVEPVPLALHDDGTREAEMVMQLSQLRLGCGGRIETAIVGQRIPVERPEHMAMRVAAVGWQAQDGPARFRQRWRREFERMRRGIRRRHGHVDRFLDG
jgi:hypothetical protein